MNQAWTRSDTASPIYCSGLPSIPSPFSNNSTLAFLWRSPCPTLSWCNLSWADSMFPDPLYSPFLSTLFRGGAETQFWPISVSHLPGHRGCFRGGHICQLLQWHTSWNPCGPFWKRKALFLLGWPDIRRWVWSFESICQKVKSRKENRCN